MNSFLEKTMITRHNIEQILNNHTEEQINKVVAPFNNNLIWNYCHLIATQQLLTYGLAGLPTLIPMEEINKFRKGTKPEEHVSWDEYKKWCTLSQSTNEQLEKDIDAGLFKDYSPYKTSYGVELKNIEEAIQFNTIHDGLHLGSCLAIRKFL